LHEELISILARLKKKSYDTWAVLSQASGCSTQRGVVKRTFYSFDKAVKEGNQTAVGHIKL